MTADAANKPIKICLLSLHGLIRARDPELGRDSDTGGQVKYVLELARELASRPDVREVQLLTRQIIDKNLPEDYAQLEEPICDGAKIVRIPFGPKRYLKKEALWPYIEMFIDQTLFHFRRNGLPDILHGHYADAGLAGAQLARLLRIPYIFTGHSLGRVKRQQLLKSKTSTENLENKYNFMARYEAEEIALETASVVITSTHQEVEQQYAIYDHYVPSRMEVIPPGVDLESFCPPPAEWQDPPIADNLGWFLRDISKPIILTMARPDERKNLEQLLHVYGQSKQLQEMANLVMLLGTREDILELPKAQQKVLTNVLLLIDNYDLYGRVAYPKSHKPLDIPALYQLAVQRRGVFINPAFTEPFGLTLLEAGASGLPILATDDGGPRDIIGNCDNGLLIDPNDREGIERALLRVLTEPEQWKQWSEAGIKGTREHYSWTHHVDRYLRNVNDLLEPSASKEVVTHPKDRRLPDFDRLIITDLDNTLTGDTEGLNRFIEMLKNNENVGFGIATGRRLDTAMDLINELKLPKPDLIFTDVGTQLHYGKSLTPDHSWLKQIDYGWKPDEIRKSLQDLPGLYSQKDIHQSEYKISYEIDRRKGPRIPTIKKKLRAAGIRAKVVHSLDMFLDIIPVRGGSELAMRHLLWKWGFSPEHVLVAGDSGNDAGMLLGRTLGVVVGNYSAELERLRGRPRVYFAKACHAAGVLEGIDYYQFLGNPVIPNDGSES